MKIRQVRHQLRRTGLYSKYILDFMKKSAAGSFNLTRHLKI